MILDGMLSSARQDDPPDWSTVSLTDLHYSYFLGDVRFLVGTADFSTHWGWVPLLDFGVSLGELVADLKDGAEGIFEFTESEATIQFRRSADVVEITASYTPDIGRIDFHHLGVSVHSFIRVLAAKVGDEHPSLQKNPNFIASIRRFESIYRK